MILSELYEAVGGDYQDILERLDDAETVENFVIKFLDDPSYTRLLQYLQESNLKCAFHAAHTLKGISQSLGFNRLGNCTESLCNELRMEVLPSKILLQQLKSEYCCAITAINDFKSGI